jgi:hypothetical protein
MRPRPGTYYFILRCMASCKNLEQLDCCERMINNLVNARFANELASIAIITRCEMIVQRYPVTE